jgi:DNA-binding MarR family transcriptional regulator
MASTLLQRTRRADIRADAPAVGRERQSSRHATPGADPLAASASRASGQRLIALLDAMDRARLSPMELLVLLHVAHDGASVGELAERLDRRRVDVRRAAARLTARGLLRRRSDPTVRWGHRFTATEAGLDALRGLGPGGRCVDAPIPGCW